MVKPIETVIEKDDILQPQSSDTDTATASQPSGLLNNKKLRNIIILVSAAALTLLAAFAWLDMVVF